MESFHEWTFCVWLKGYDSTCGLFSKVDNAAAVDSVVVTVLKRQGAIPFIKTNIAQGLYK